MSIFTKILHIVTFRDKCTPVLLDGNRQSICSFSLTIKNLLG